MDKYLTAIMTKTTGSAFSTAVGGRIYLDDAPDKATFPYCVYFIVSAVPNDTFSEKLDDILIQFELYSMSKGATEITGMYSKLRSLFDDCTLTITDATSLSMSRENLMTTVEEMTTTAGTVGVKHWSVDYLGKVHYTA
jgi:hypothetical protein